MQKNPFISIKALEESAKICYSGYMQKRFVTKTRSIKKGLGIKPYCPKQKGGKQIADAKIHRYTQMYLFDTILVQ